MVDAEKSPAELFQTIKNWYNTCKESHELCRRPDGILHPLPTRVIDVGYNSSSLLSLLPSNGQKGHYAALSYCWGASQTFTTTAETFASRCSGFSLADLPQTIRDAVITTREMGLRYLWVDAICIIQGDASDWASESTKMAQVYGNAEITICATSSPDTISGLFRPRWSANKNAIAVQSRCSAGGQTGTMVLSTRLGSVDDVMDDAVLNTRAWCLQERILSHRIIHFAQDQLYWECQQHLQAEEGLNIPSPNSLKKSLRTRDPEPWSTMLRHWHATLVDYTRRNLSHLSDKLPAVSGLARMVYEQSQVDYVAGLWREDLPFALLW
ncbi:heterokaryon incompatibility protein-domain-containing protein, partial [Clohesyomyces aquaticus]